MLTLVLTLVLITALGCDSDSPHSSRAPEGGQTSDLTPQDAETPTEALDMGLPPDMAPPERPPEVARGAVLAGVTSRGHWDGQGGAARFDGVTCLAPTPDGRFIWMSDTFSGTIRRLTVETSEVTTVAGRPYELAVVDGARAEARFESPRGCAITTADSALGAAFWVADSSTLRRLSLDELGEEVLRVETVAGRAGERGSADGLGPEARLGYLIHDITVSPSGDTLYLADRSNDRIRAVRMEGGLARVSLLAGGASVARDGVGAEAGFDGPGGLAWRAARLLVADTFSGRLREIDLETAEVRTLATGLNDPQGVTSIGDEAWVAGFDGLLWRVSLTSGDAEVVVGVPGETQAVDGRGEEVRLGGTFASLRHHALDGWLFYMDMSSGSVRRVSLDPVSAETLAGPSFVGAYRDGALSKARFGAPLDVVGAPSGVERQIKWYVSDLEHSALREVDEARGAVSTLFGGVTTDEVVDGPLEQATAPGPSGLAYDPLTSSLYVADLVGHVIRRVDLRERAVYTVAGVAGERGSADGPLGEGRLDTPLGLALSPSGLLYIVDGARGVLRALDLSTGELSTRSEAVAGLWDVVISEGGAVYGSDELEATLLKLDPVTERWEVVAGSSGQTGPADGQEGLLARPMGLTLGDGGLILIADADNSSIRSFDPNSGSLGTFVGSASRPGGQGGYEPTPWGALSLFEPSAVIWEPTLGRGGALCEGALYGLWSAEAQVEEPAPPPPPLTDLPVGDFEVELGTGPERFTPLSMGDTVTLHRGCQGAQHVWVSLKVTGMTEAPISFELSLRDSTQVLASMYLEGEPWEHTESGTYDQVGLSFVVFDAEAAIGRPLVLGVEVRSAEGRIGYGWREVRVEWGADSCGG